MRTEVASPVLPQRSSACAGLPSASGTDRALTSAAFSARATFWTICKDAKGLERLAGGIVPGRLEEIEDYDAQVLRVRMPEATLILLRGEAKRLETSPSLLVARIVEDWIEGVDPT